MALHLKLRIFKLMPASLKTRPPRQSRQERRRFPRTNPPVGLNVSLVKPTHATVVNSLNAGPSGLCLRVQEALEIHSQVRLALNWARHRELACSGRVAWVTQRLDLRSAPPFLYDVGIEFVSPPTALKQWFSAGKRSIVKKTFADGRTRKMEPWSAGGREFVPRLSRGEDAAPWHLIVRVDGAPCFSGHYKSEREALASWVRFKRKQKK